MKGSKALYARFKANLQPLEVKVFCAEKGYDRVHAWRVLTGQREGSADFWAAFGPWCAPRPRVGRDGRR